MQKTASLCFFTPEKFLLCCLIVAEFYNFISKSKAWSPARFGLENPNPAGFACAQKQNGGIYDKKKLDH
ncbi:hypothetical protein [Desulfonema magnum]|uniref:Uncharacterized protein n=1 Tax=Desulfonema magnum TaxID=45655 RepID=A0A975BXZ3_9BACT|nr:hypothetical protein [Desulfonema magnum]QTA93844.1 Uncharacterized protein dnm_099520 [Desulfonema magnum]